MITITIHRVVIFINTRRQVNIRLNAYIDDLLNAVVNKTDFNKTDVIYRGIEQVALDVLGADLVNEIRLKQFNSTVNDSGCSQTANYND